MLSGHYTGALSMSKVPQTLHMLSGHYIHMCY